jgi:hypothetical protein
LFFTAEDGIKKRFGTAIFLLALGVLAVFILMSGERKAYLLLLALFFLSNLSLGSKILFSAVGAAALATYLGLAQDNNYIQRQLASFFNSAPERKMEEFFLIPDIGHKSDLVREFVNRNARQLFYDNPLFGLGATGYQAWALQTFAGMEEGFATNVHGEINRVPVENGVVGITFALLYLFGLIRNIWLYFKKSGGLLISSREKLPLYAFVFMIPYFMTETTNTLMLTLILMFGFYATRLGERTKKGAAA